MIENLVQMNGGIISVMEVFVLTKCNFSLSYGIVFQWVTSDLLSDTPDFNALPSITNSTLDTIS